MKSDASERIKSYALVAEALKGVSRSRAERETIIVMTDDQAEAEIYSCSRPMIRYLSRYSQKTGIPFTKVSPDGVEIRVPRDRVRLAIPRQYSGAARERRQQWARRAGEARASRKVSELVTA